MHAAHDAAFGPKLMIEVQMALYEWLHFYNHLAVELLPVIVTMFQALGLLLLSPKTCLGWIVTCNMVA